MNMEQMPTCPICLELPVDAFVSQCGHSVCIVCKNALYDRTISKNVTCPICKKQTQYIPNFALREILQSTYPAEYATRQAQFHENTIQGQYEKILKKWPGLSILSGLKLELQVELLKALMDGITMENPQMFPRTIFQNANRLTDTHEDMNYFMYWNSSGAFGRWNLKKDKTFTQITWKPPNADKIIICIESKKTLRKKQAQQ